MPNLVPLAPSPLSDSDDASKSEATSRFPDLKRFLLIVSVDLARHDLGLIPKPPRPVEPPPAARPPPENISYDG